MSTVVDCEFQITENGVTFKETKKLIELNGSRSVSIHTFHVGEKKYEIKQITHQDGQVDETIDTNCKEDEKENFWNVWRTETIVMFKTK